MPIIKIPRGWEIPEREATPEKFALERREFLRHLAATTASGLVATVSMSFPRRIWPASPSSMYPAKRNSKFTLDRPLSDEKQAALYNNFYEFTETKEVSKYTAKFNPRPWTVEVTGLVAKPRKFHVDELIRLMPVEERLYRHRCVEAWAMAVPWTGFPFSALARIVEPLPSARFVRFQSFLHPAEAPSQSSSPWYPWPYQEGLRLDEAMNELTFLACGIYGHNLPKQHGAPLRLVVPWKYGYKSIKSIVRIEFTKSQPATFWNTVVPSEYDFWSNVNPKVPHPRWSQATETMIGTMERRATMPFNGYADWVAHLYQK